ncbi:MAG TPA: hypothetical protein VJH95_05830 [Candidatus Nanoarchaeia archaeon]|nr:hypothetical protein [Candidatus Nanoarchaeia archaeon]
MLENHAFGNFVPKHSRYLILGSFPVKQAVKGTNYDKTYDFFYSIKRNQFWPILEAVYGLELATKAKKQQLLSRLGIAMADIILKCTRTRGSNLDNNLSNFHYNLAAIKEILDTHHIEKIYFTSCFVAKQFRKFFKAVIEAHPATELITLPSPSPRYALVSKEQKILMYKALLPKHKT